MAQDPGGGSAAPVDAADEALLRLLSLVPASRVLYATMVTHADSEAASSLSRLQFRMADYKDVELLVGEAPTLVGCVHQDPYASAILLFPTTLHGVRRADLHQLAEAGGLQHLSVGRGPTRRLVVHGRGGLESAMLVELCAILIDSGSSKPAAPAPDWARLPPTCRLWAAGMAAAAALEDGTSGTEGLLDVLAIEGQGQGQCTA